MALLAAAGIENLTASDVFEGITPEGIAAVYEKKNGDSSKEDARTVELRERRHPHPLTPNQIDMLDYNFFRAGDAMWDIPLLYQFGLDIDAKKLCDALHEVCVSRSSLSTVLFLDVHHAVIDGMGLQLLFDDIAKAYLGEPLPLDTYYTYLAKEEKVRSSSRYQEAGEYYGKLYGNDKWCSNISQDTDLKPFGRKDIPMKRAILHQEADAFESRNHYSRNIMMVVLSLLSISCMEKEDRVLTTWIYHDRTDPVNQNALGCLFRYIPVGMTLRDDMMLGDLFREMSRRSGESLAHSCLFLQSMHMKDAIVTMIVINDSIFSDEKKKQLNDVLSTILDRLLKWNAAEDITLAELLKGLR